MRRSIATLVVALWLVPGALSAQEAGALPAGHPPVPGQAPVGGGAARGMSPQMQRVLRPPEPAQAVESPDVPVGTIRVLVVDEAGQPVPDQAVDVGMLAGGERERVNGRTGGDGIATFSELVVGSERHYRVNVPHAGATYSTMPFALPSTGGGYSVRVVRLPVTQDDQLVFFHMFRTVVEQRGERMHVIHQGEITNAGTSTYAFPAEGVRARLPEDALAFQFQRVITDQRVEELPDQHAYVLRGSLPPGTVQLAWAYDIPIAGGDMSLPVDIPLAVFTAQVIVEAVPELEVSLRGLPQPQRLDVNAQPCESSQTSEGCAWVAHTQRAPSDGRLDRIVIRISGIPGPGPVRLVATGLLAVFMIGGFLLLIAARGAGTGLEAREARRDALRDEAHVLAEDLASGDVGPEYAARRRTELARELAGLYYADEVASTREEAEDAFRAGTLRRPGVAGFLLPSPAAASLMQYVEYLLTFWALPLLVLPLAFVAVRPRAALSLRGHGELAITLVLGLCGVAGLWMIGSTVLPAFPGLVWTFISVSALALTLRAIFRHAPPPPPARAVS